jgi:hypothetical protein
MFTVFFKTTDMVFIDHKEKGCTVSAKYYIENSLNPVIERMSQLRKKIFSKIFKSSMTKINLMSQKPLQSTSKRSASQ